MNKIIKTIETSTGTYKVSCIETIEYHPSWFTHEDEKSVREKIWKPSENDLVFDVGAMYGSYTLTALLQGAKFVYSWAPEAGAGVNDAPEKEFLENSLQINNWQNKCKVFDFGFFDQDGWLDTLDDVFYKEFPSTIKNPKYFFKTTTFDKWYKNSFLQNDDVKNYKNIWMKIDVEGAEVEVLNGAINFIKEVKPIIVIENHLFIRNGIAKEVSDILMNLGYKEMYSEPYHSVSHSLFCFVE